MDRVIESVTKQWDEYPVDTVDEFIDKFTNGEKSVGGARFICLICGCSYSNKRGAEECFIEYHGSPDEYDWREHSLRIMFYPDGDKIVNYNSQTLVIQ